VPDLALVAPPARADLLRSLRTRLGEIAPGLRVVAEGVLGADAPIDFVGVEPDGRALLVMVGEPGEDLELVARGLAQKSWVQARLGDWLQLAPDLGLRPGSGVALLLVCPDFGPISRAAVRALGADAPALAVYRCVRNGAGVEVLLEPLGTAGAPHPPARTGGAPAFRTGLSDADLGITAAERSEFE
jgi:hypothetical protein